MRKNTGQDDLIRKLERKVLSGDLSAVPQLAQLYARTGRYPSAEADETKVYTAVSYNIESNDATADTFTKREDAVAFINDWIADAARRLIAQPEAEDSGEFLGLDLESAAMIDNDPRSAWEIYENEVEFNSGIHFMILEGGLDQKYVPPAPDLGDLSFRPPHFTRAQLEAMPTLSSGHTDNTKYEQSGWSVQLSRGGLEDGEIYAGRVTVLRLVNGRWETYEEYDVGPREPDEESVDEQDAPAPPRRRPRPRPGVMEGLTDLQARRAPVALQAYNNSGFGRRIVSVSNWNIAGNTWTCVVNFSAGPSVVFMVLFRPRSIEIEETSELEA